jgi:hypothetical protein
MDIYVRLFYVYVILCVGRGLATGWSPIQGALPNVYRITKLKKRPDPTKGCRTIDEWMNWLCCMYVTGGP